MNCWGIWFLLDKFNCKDFFNWVNIFIEENFMEVVKFEEFLLLFYLDLGELLMNDEIVIIWEEDFYELLLKWVEYNC